MRRRRCDVPSTPRHLDVSAEATRVDGPRAREVSPSGPLGNTTALPSGGGPAVLAGASCSSSLSSLLLPWSAARDGPPALAGRQDPSRCCRHSGDARSRTRASLTCAADSTSSRTQSRRVGVAGTGTSTRRSTTSTAQRPDAAARPCSPARRRQPTDHHLGIGPRDRGAIAPPHQSHGSAAARRAPPTEDPRGDASGRTDCSLLLRREARSRRCRSAPCRLFSTISSGARRDRLPLTDDDRGTAAPSSRRRAAREMAADGATATSPAEPYADPA